MLHPALEGSPGHAHWAALCAPDGCLEEPGRAAGLFSVILDAAIPQARVDAFCDALRLFKLGFSWGGPVSLVVPYDLAAMRMVWPAGLRRGALVRFSAGLEAAADLVADLEQAFAALAG